MIVDAKAILNMNIIELKHYYEQIIDKLAEKNIYIACDIDTNSIIMDFDGMDKVVETKEIKIDTSEIPQEAIEIANWIINNRKDTDLLQLSKYLRVAKGDL